MPFHVPEQIPVVRLKDCTHATVAAEERLDRQQGDALHLRHSMIAKNISTKFPDLVQIVDAGRGKGIVIIKKTFPELFAVGIFHPFGTGGNAETQFPCVPVDAQGIVTFRLKPDSFGLSAVHDNALSSVGVTVPDKQDQFPAVVFRQRDTGGAAIVFRLEYHVHPFLKIMNLRWRDNQITDIMLCRPHCKGFLFQSGIIRFQNTEFFGIMKIYQKCHIRS